MSVQRGLCQRSDQLAAHNLPRGISVLDGAAGARWLRGFIPHRPGIFKHVIPFVLLPSAPRNKTAPPPTPGAGRRRPYRPPTPLQQVTDGPDTSSAAVTRVSSSPLTEGHVATDTRRERGLQHRLGCRTPGHWRRRGSAHILARAASSITEPRAANAEGGGGFSVPPKM